MNVFRIEKAVRGHRTATLAVRARIHKQNAVSAIKQYGRKSGHPFAVVGNAMEHDHILAVVIRWAEVPTFELDAISGCNFGVLHCALVSAFELGSDVIAIL